MSKLINELYPLDEAELFEDETECEFEISFEPMVDKESGEIVAVLMVKTCLECGTETVEQVFTNGDIDIELICQELGYREENNDEEGYYS